MTTSTVATTHTPGPWHLGTDTFPIGVLSDHRNGCNDPEQIAYIGGDIMAPESVEENEANARLIAAAPDLLAACYQALETPDSVRTTNMLLAAIAKAEGR